MFSAVPALLLAFLSQVGGDADPDMPYAIFSISRDEWLSAFVDEKEWDRPRMTVYLDEPWLPPEERRVTLRRSDIRDDYHRELTTVRDDRINDGWRSQGFVLVETAIGEDWVHVDELELAGRATDMEEQSLAEAQHESDSAEIHLGELVGSPNIGFMDLWGAHIAILSVGVLLSGAIVWLVWLR